MMIQMRNIVRGGGGGGQCHAHSLLFRLMVCTRSVTTKRPTCLVVNAGSSSLKLEIVSDLNEITSLDSMDDVCGDDVDCVVHRVVHGGEIYSEASIVNETLLRDVEDLSALAPLHNPVAVEKMRDGMRMLPGIPHVACFDTAFHTKTMSEIHYRYAIPTNRKQTKRIRKYGFHGLNHQYVSGEAARQLNLLETSSAIVVAHLGNGASVCAVRDGKSVNTSMVRLFFCCFLYVLCL
jgi:acetate kinase